MKSRAGPPSKFAVAAANPLATDAGYQVLKAGGSAIDAAIAVQMVLTLVEPQSSGIGGGAFLLHYNGRDVEAFDGRETAPAAADDKLFLGADGKPLAFYDGVVGGRSVGVPGTVRMLEMAHKQYGKLPWAQLIQPAIVLAEGGFKVSPRLNTMAKGDAHLKKDPTATAYFFKADGEPRDVGSTLRNPELAAVLRKIAAEGSKALHEGEIAQAIVDKVQKHPTNPGKMTLADLAGYQPKKRAPICHDYRAQEQGLPHLRFPAAEFRRDRRGPDPGHPGRHQRRHPAAAGRAAFRRLAAPVHRSVTPGFCRPRPVPGRSRFRAAAGRQLDEPAGAGVPGRTRTADPACRPEHEDRSARHARRRRAPATRPCRTSRNTAPPTSASSIATAMPSP